MFLAAKSPPSRRNSLPFSAVRYGIAVNSGTSALHLALLAAGVGAGVTRYYRPDARLSLPLPALFYRSKPVSWMSIQLHTPWIRKNLKQRSPENQSHSTGSPLWKSGRYGRITALPSAIVVVIEDSAQAHGAEYRGRRCGSIGEMGCFSFTPVRISAPVVRRACYH